MSNTTIAYIDPKNIYPNPLNPRKQLGDLSELTGSIRVYGVLQNLTVVPYDPQVHTGLTVADPANAYCAVIGHRRHAAALEAGLSEVPCIIDTDMSPAKQVSIMLLENGQRENLTVYEEAQGYQMLLDMGETVDTIASMTGFCGKTIRSRVKLLDLDKEKFAAASERGATLSDYAQLDKIKNISLKNEVLDAIGTDNFANALKRALSTQKKQEYFSGALAELAKFATQIQSKEDIPDLRYEKQFATWMQNKVEVPDDTDKCQYYFVVSESHGETEVRLYSNRPAEPDTTAELRAEYSRHHATLQEATNRAYELRKDFVRDYSSAKAKKHFTEIAAFLGSVAMNRFDGYRDMPNGKLLAKLLEIPYDDEVGYNDAEFRQAIERSPEYTLLCVAYARFERDYYSCFGSTYNQDRGVSETVYVNNERLDILYDFLEKLGYKQSDEEKHLLNGSHPSFHYMEAESSAQDGSSNAIAVSA